MGKWKVIDALKGMYGKKVHAHMGKKGDRPVLILADKNSSSFDRLIFIEVDGNNIKKITSTPELGTLSLAEGFSYRKDSAYIILKIMSYMIYEKDCSGLLNYLSEDVVYVDGDGETGGCYAALRKLENLCEDKDGKRPDVYIVEATAPGEKYGKLVLGLSFAGPDSCHKVIFIRLEDGKITWIKADDNNYRIEELHKGYMGRIPNTASGWLEYFRYWILGKPMPEEFFKDRVGSDCVLDIVSCGIMSKKTGKVIRHIEENDDIFCILTKLLFKLVIGHPCKVEGDALIWLQFRMTLECGARERMKPLYEKSSINEIKAIKFEAILSSKYH
ncbi:MAG: hypothetical protein LUD41_02645 [Phascolarctobacterium sp.]|nr:hypothetical protein [Phascolarctobacterium sp.]